MALKISIVTPSYNQAEFLEATLLSVLNQGYPNLEYIVIDGGSSDGSVEILERYRPRLSYLVSERDKGQTDALIKGFARATGDVLAWLNSDDLYEPWTLRQVAAFFTRRPAARFVFGDARWVDRAGRFLRPKREIPFNRFLWLHSYNYIPQPSTFWRRNLYQQVGGLDPAFDLAMDADLWARFSNVTPLHHVPRSWSRMREYPEQKNQKRRVQSDAEDRRVRERFVRTAGLRWRAGRVLARGLRVSWKAATGCYRR
ncbi:MAG: glycosyltransferase family 2 protein [Dehalococcoidia bacterium]